MAVMMPTITITYATNRCAGSVFILKALYPVYLLGVNCDIRLCSLGIPDKSRTSPPEIFHEAH
jgi:hypothetical protein